MLEISKGKAKIISFFLKTISILLKVYNFSLLITSKSPFSILRKAVSMSKITKYTLFLSFL